MATAVLHNLSVLQNEYLPDDDDNESDEEDDDEAKDNHDAPIGAVEQVFTQRLTARQSASCKYGLSRPCS